MKRTHGTRSKKLTIILAILVALGLLLAVLEKTQVTDLIRIPGRADRQTQSGPTPEQIKQDAAVSAGVKEGYLEDGTKTDEDVQPSAQSIDLSAKQEPNQTVTITTKLYGYSSGACSLKITNGSKNFTQEAAVMYQAEFSTCAGFSVPTTALGPGTWNITLTLTANGQPVSKNISLTVT